MCGIAGTYHVHRNKHIDQEMLVKMCNQISHRGPDDHGFFIDQEHGIGLGHRRLSIIDLSTGHQPMSNERGDIWMVFNGEIYNYLELKKELQAKGYNFRTTSDTEVIIYLYQEYGENSFNRLNGIFSLAIYDKSKESLILARDHFGVKPLYFFNDTDSLIFGSEIKVIIQDPSFKRELDFEALNSFLTFRYNPSPQTLFKGIKKLFPGHYLKIGRNVPLEIKPFAKSQPETNHKISEQDAISEYQRLLENAIKRQMVSDVPVGLLLSGGVDSAVMGKIMQDVSPSKIKTFTIGFEGSGDFNELPDARKTAEFIGSQHFEMSISQQDYLDFFFKSFHYTEEPIAEMTIPALYYVSKLASEHVKVALAGQGADEPLAGYKRYYGEKKISQYFKLLNALPLQKLTSLLPRNERLKRAAYASQFTNELERFLAIYTIFTPEQKEGLLRKDVRHLLVDSDLSLVNRLYQDTSKLDDSLSKILFIDTRMSLSDNLLIFGDKMSMANSLEMRVPFLDVELINFIETLSPSLKIKGSTHKYIHKEAVKKWLPDEIIYRKKRGFATPMDQWLQQDFSNHARELFNDEKSACRKYFDIQYINNILDKHQSKRENFQRNIFALLSFEIWHKTFFESKVS